MTLPASPNQVSQLDSSHLLFPRESIHSAVVVLKAVEVRFEDKRLYSVRVQHAAFTVNSYGGREHPKDKQRVLGSVRLALGYFLPRTCEVVPKLPPVASHLG